MAGRGGLGGEEEGRDRMGGGREETLRMMLLLDMAERYRQTEGI